jgi:hypothetical protein
MAFLLYSERRAFRGKAALVIATVISGWGATLGHVYQMTVNHDSDIAINAVGLAFRVGVGPEGEGDDPGRRSSSGTGAR